MEKSLDELIEFLIAKIADNGAQGSSLLQLIEYTKSFYAVVSGKDQIPHGLSSPSSVHNADSQNVDQNFILQVWKWLAKQPRICIGPNNEFGKTPLHEFWTTSENATLALSKASDEAPRIFLRQINTQGLSERKRNDPDFIPPKELELLSRIAKAGRHGILQGDLGRATGQHKHSVPKRTDALRDRGLIVKEVTYINSNTKTSRLKLIKYATGDEHAHVTSTTKSHDQLSIINQVRKVRDVIDNITGLCANFTRLEVGELASKIGIEGNASMKVLNRIIRVMHRAGCIRSFRMAVAPDAQAGDVKTHIQYRRARTDQDSSVFDKANISLDQTLTDLVAGEDAKSSPTTSESDNQAPEQDGGAQEQDQADQQNDEFGFPITESSIKPAEITTSTLTELIRLTAAHDIVPDNSLPRSSRAEHQRLDLLASTKRGSTDATPKKRRTARPRSRSVETSANEEVKPTGRPRKFLRGTEKFWRYIFWTARREAHEDEDELPPKAGSMSDPLGRAVFLNRPEDFDDTLVQAKAGGLTLPKHPEDVSRDWVSRTSHVLDRTETGAYVTPAGMFLGQTSVKSQLLIVRSNRLQTVDFSARQAPRHRSLVSSAAHSFAYLPKDIYELVRKQKAATTRAENPLKHVRKKLKKKAAPQGPPKGVFSEPVTPSLERPIKAYFAPELFLPFTSSQFTEVMNETETESEVREQAPSSRTSSRRDSHVSTPMSVTSAGTSSAAETDNTPRKRLRAPRSPLPARSSRPARARKPTQRLIEAVSDGRVASAISASLSPNPLEGRDDDAPVATPHELQQNYSSDVAQETRIDEGMADASATTLEPIDQNKFRRKSADKENQELVSDANSLAPANSKLSEKRKRSRLGFDNGESAIPLQEALRTTSKTPKELSKLCRKIIVALVILANEAAPADPVTIRRAMLHRWYSEDGGDPPPTDEMIKKSIKVLDSRGQLKKHEHGFRHKDHVRWKPMIVHPSVDVKGDLVVALKKKVREAYPGFYVPPEWMSEIAMKHDTITASQLVMPEYREESSPEPPSSKQKKQKQPSPRQKSFSRAAFLTLKIPRIAELSQVHTFNPNLQDPEWKQNLQTAFQEPEPDTAAGSPAYLPSVPIMFNPSASFVQAAALPTPLEKRKSGLRGGLRRTATGKRFDPTTHEVIVDHLHQGLPYSLTAILQDEQAQTARSVSVPVNISQLSPCDKNRLAFFEEYDSVKSWELGRGKDIQVSLNKLTFINHTVPISHWLSATPQYWLLVGVVQQSFIIESPHFDTKSWPPFALALQQAQIEKAASPSVSNEIDELPLAEPRQTLAQDEAGLHYKRRRSLAPEDAQYAPPAKRSRKTKPSRKVQDAQHTPLAKRSRASNAGRKPNRSVISDDDDNVDGVADAVPEPQPVEMSRPAQALDLVKKMSKEEMYRLTVIIVCIQTLAGGLDRHVDWSLVHSVVPNQQVTPLLTECWDIMQERYGTDIKALTESLQETYIEALAQGSVSVVDLDDAQATDWNGIVSWALQNLDADVATKKALDLPSRTLDFSSSNELSYRDSPSIRTLFEPTHPVKKIDKSRREEVYKTTIFGNSSAFGPSGTDMEDEATARIRSLVLSRIMCPDDRYSEDAADAKLKVLLSGNLEGDMLEQPIVKTLHEDRWIAIRAGHRRNALGLRRFETTVRFQELFSEKSCLITMEMLKDAAKYKTSVLDEAFARGEKVHIAKDAPTTSGEMLALMQLLGSGAIDVRPGSDVPNTRYGVEWERVGYETRKLAKDSFGFGVVVSKRDGCRYEDVLRRAEAKVPVSDAGWTPIWVDVVGIPLMEVWEMVLGAILGVVAMRSGVSSEEISKSLRAVGVWEVNLVLEWAAKSGLVKTTSSGSGWEVREWWWMCLRRRDDET